MAWNAEVLWMLAEHLLLTAAPGVAAGSLCLRYRLHDVPLVLGVSLAASGVAAILAFWAYYASPTIGGLWAFAVLLGSGAIAVWSWRRAEPSRQVLAKLRVPLILWILGSVFVVYFGFLHGGTDQAVGMATLRFSHPLPTDNDIPQFYASWFFENGHRGTPPIYPGEWLSSDRPPLQIGYVLSQRTFAWDAPGLHYQVLGATIQQLWIVGMWAILCAARLPARTRGLAIFAAMVSDIAIVHGFFVWPKLLASAFLLAAVAIVISKDWERRRRDPRVAGLLGCLCALALLAHGASVFGIVPLLVLGAMPGVPSLRWLGVALLVGLILIAPWSAYQRYGDPPGDRLLKWQLGGVVEIDDRGALDTLVDSYREAGVGGALDAKWGSFAEMTGIERTPDAVDATLDAALEGGLDRAVGTFRGLRFFALLPFLGVLLAAPVSMLLARERGRQRVAEWRFALFCLAFAAIGCLVWGLLLFGAPNAIATIHAGTLAIPLLTVCGCVAGLRATYPRLAVGVVTGNALAILALYTPSLSPPPDTSYSALAAAIAAASLAGFAWVAFRGPAGPASPSLKPPLTVRAARRCGGPRG